MALFSLLTALGALTDVPIPAPVHGMLTQLTADGFPADPAPTSGTVHVSADLPIALGATVASGTILGWAFEKGVSDSKFTLRFTGVVAKVGGGLTAATVTTTGEGATSRMHFSAAGDLNVTLTGTMAIHFSTAGASLSIESLTVTPAAAILLPAGFGLKLPASLSVADDIVNVTGMELVLPDAVPLLGGIPLTASVSGGADAQSVNVSLPPTGTDPKVSGSLTFRLPASFSLADLVPTLADVLLALPPGSTPFGAGGPSVTGNVSIRAVLTRAPADPLNLTIAVTAQSDQPDGLVGGGGSDAGALALGITFVLGPAIAAQLGAMGPGSLLALYGAANVLGDKIATHGDYALTAVTLQAAPAAKTLVVLLDVEGGIGFKEIDLGVAKISMDANRPMRVRWRGITATVDLAAIGVKGAADALDIDFRTARCDVIDPGGWQISAPAIPDDVLQIVGTRSGSGSTWVEVDLRFALDLGPVKICGATVRGTWDASGNASFGIRGFDAQLELPGVVDGGGKFQLDSSNAAHGITVELWGTLIPLNVGGFFIFSMKTAGGVTQYVFGMGLDLPAAIPLGPTGLGVYSIAGSFGANSAMKSLAPAGDDAVDPLGVLRAWTPWKPDSLTISDGDITVGAGVVVGTVPDGGLTFGALGVLGITVPDFALRLGINGKLFQTDRQTMAALTDGGASVATGLTLFGGISATSEALFIGVDGQYNVPYVVSVDIPVAAQFDFGHADNWYLRAGSDEGIGSHDHRAPGPLQATVFPGLGPLEVTGWAFVMLSGNGITNVAGTAISPQGFAIALGVGFSKTFGVKGVLWASVSTSLIAAIGTRPVIVWAEGRLAGEVGIGPFTLGVDALLQVQVGPADRLDFHLRVCAVVDLWFTTLEGCIELGAIDPAAAPPIDPSDDEWPWPRVDLADGLGHVLPNTDSLRGFVGAGEAATPPPPIGSPPPAPPAAPLAPADWTKTPAVWTDTIPLLTFPIAPVPDPGVPGENSKTNGGRSGAGRTTFRWRLTSLLLQPVDKSGAPAGTAVDLTRSAWQPALGLPADAAAVSSARQLALLTRSRWIPFVHAGDGTGAGDALRGAVGLCHLSFAPGGAWTYGLDARRAVATGDWHVARRDGGLSFSPFTSLARGVGFRIGAPDRQPGLGQSGVDWGEGPVGYPEELKIEVPTDEGNAGASFVGAFRTSSPRSVAIPGPHDEIGGAGETTYRITLDEPADSGDLVLTARLLGLDAQRGIDEFGATARAMVETEGGASEPVTAIKVQRSPAAGATETDAIVIIILPTGRRVTAISWTLTWAATVEIVGLYARASVDVDAAEAAEEDRKKSLATDAAEAKPGTDAGGLRTILTPGAKYRISVSLAWTRITDDGSAKAPTEELGQARTSTWFFRTAGIPSPGVAPITIWKNSVGSMPLVSFKVDTFSTEYLDRYLIGYTIADGEQYVFTHDRPSAQFRAPHVRTLAGTYGRDLGLLLKPTNRPDPPVFRKPKIVGIFGPLAPPFSDPVAAASAEYSCPIPPREAEAVWPTVLEPSTPYQLAVALPPRGKPATADSPQLRAITFVTSAFTGPEQLVAALGFTRSVSKKALASAASSGHLPVTSATSLSATSSAHDDEFEEAIAALGLPPLRVPDPTSTGGLPPGRSSLLWVKLPDGHWALHGLLLESSEPLVRQDGARMDVTDAAYYHTSSLTVGLAIRRRDRTGTRALWLLQTPIVPTAARILRLNVVDRGAPFWMRITVPAAPPFAGSAIVGRNRP